MWDCGYFVCRFTELVEPIKVLSKSEQNSVTLLAEWLICITITLWFKCQS